MRQWINKWYVICERVSSAVEEGNKMEDSMAGVDGAKGKKLDGKSQGDGKASPHRASWRYDLTLNFKSFPGKIWHRSLRGWTLGRRSETITIACEKCWWGQCSWSYPFFEPSPKPTSSRNGLYNCGLQATHIIPLTLPDAILVIANFMCIE